MTIADECSDCGGLIDVTQRIYRGPGGKPRCGVCQFLTECEISLAQARAILEAAAFERGEK
jgi:hypothetical protein